MSKKLKLKPCPNCGKLIKPIKKSNGNRVRFCSYVCGSTGKFNGRWKGKHHFDNFGYKLIWVNKKDRRGRSSCYMREHRYIFEKFLNRKLDFNDIVHHKNHNIQDNRLSNLEIISRGKHSSFHNSALGKTSAKKHGVFLSLRQSQSKLHKKQ